MSSSPLPITADQGPSAAAKTGLAGNAPLLAVCCLLSILFLVASTIVLALIPVYLPTKDSGTAVSNSQYVTLSQSGVPGYGAASSSACDTIASSMGTAVGSSGSLSSSACSFAESSGRRKRAWSRSRTRRAASFCIMRISINVSRCRKCSSKNRERWIGIIFSATFFYFGSFYTTSFTVLSFSTSEPSGFSTIATTTTSTAASATSAASG